MAVGEEPVRFAMIGGGTGSFIGPVHRSAAMLDNVLRLEAGCFSSDPERNRVTGRSLGIAPDRIYDSYQDLVEGEARRDPLKRVDFISIVTPNHLHAPASCLALENGFAVMCEKPLALDLAEARRIAQAVAQSGRPFAITYTYLGYPLVREARGMVQAGLLGEIVRIGASYTQGWLADSVEQDGNLQAAWRTDPKRAGLGGAIGDIGVHAQNLVEYVAGSPIVELCAELRASRPGRILDDDGAMLLRFANGARGTLVASQICVGDENRLTLSVYGTKGALHWEQEKPGVLWHRPKDGPARRITANPDLLSDPLARAMTRLPGGHPEGYIEAFANLYRAFTLQLRGKITDGLPSISEGVRSLAFIDAAHRSSAAGGVWTDLDGTGGRSA